MSDLKSDPAIAAATPLSATPLSATPSTAAAPRAVTPDDTFNPALLSKGFDAIQAKEVAWYSYLTTPDFWFVIVLGQVLSLCITATNTFSSFLSGHNTSVPSLQSIFVYAVLSVIYTGVFFYSKGWRAWFRILIRSGWRYFIMAFLDVQGNYFTVLAYRYTNLLSAQLLNFWSIVCVVLISFTLLHVRYKIPQIIGILIACGGMGILLASDHITGSNGDPGVNMLKGDLFGLLGATLYGTSNVFEEWLVSKRPMYEVLSFLGSFGLIIIGVQAAIFDRGSIQSAEWGPQVYGYIAGFTAAMAIFYTLAPFILRMGSSAFFDISLLTANFWGVIVGIKVFHYSIHFMYPIAFVCIIIGLVVYFLSGSILGDSKKPWLGDNQEEGVSGWGTAKLKALNEAKKRAVEGEERMVGRVADGSV